MRPKSTKEIGDALENPVADIFRRLGYKVKQNCQIEGHQIDIYAEKDDEEGHIFHFGIDCKNYKTKIGIRIATFTLEAFDDLRRKGRIDKGIIVSEKGFTPAAYNCVKGTEYVELHTTSDLRIMLEKKTRENTDARSMEDFSAKYIPGVTLMDLDKEEISRVKERIKKENPGLHSLTAYDDADFLTALRLADHDGAEIKPNIACILLVGRERTLLRYLPQCEIIFLHYTDEQHYDRRENIKKPFLQAFDRVMENISVYNSIETARDGFSYRDVPIYPEGVIRESLLNAVIHRSYETSDALYVKWFEDRLEISNPGGFLSGITSTNILYHSPRHRNRRLSEFFHAINWVERVGEGVNSMYREMLQYGKAPPEFVEYEDSVTIAIPKTRLDVDFYRFVKANFDEGDRFFLDMLLILFFLKGNPKLTCYTAMEFCQRDRKTMMGILNNMARRGLLERLNNDIYCLPFAVKTALGLQVEMLEFSDSEENPYGAFLFLIREIERQLRLIAKCRDYVGFEHAPIPALVADLVKKKVMKGNLNRLIRQVWRSRNETVHGTRDMNDENLRKAISAGRVIVVELNRICKEIIGNQ